MQGTPSFMLSLTCIIAIFLLFSMIFLSASIRIVPEYKRLDVYRLGRHIGESQTTVFTDGKVMLGHSEVWDAVSQTPIPAGQHVRVVRMILEVEQE